MVVTPVNDKLKLCIDGEITECSKVEFEIVPAFFNFVVPYASERKREKIKFNTYI